MGKGPERQGLPLDPLSPALGKGPYQLASLAAGGALVAVKAAGSAIDLVRAEDVVPGDIVNFLLTAALFKAKAHGKVPPLDPLQPWVEGGGCWRRGECQGPNWLS